MSTFDVDFIENQDMDVEFDPDDEFDVGFDGMRMVDYTDQVYHKPSIEGVELVGDVTLQELGALTEETDPTVPAWAKRPTKPSYKTSEFENDAGFITAADIPPLVTDLGNIDPSDYDDDLEELLNTLTESGNYKFVWEDGDDFKYFVVVESLLDGDNTGFLYQKYWYTEEGSVYIYNRSSRYEDGELVDASVDNYLTLTDASVMFANISHTHYASVSKAKTVWDYCDDELQFDNGKPYIIYADTLNSKNWLIERYSAMRSPNQRFLRLYDLGDASHFFLRSGLYSAGVITWGNWKEYPSGGGGMNITVDGTDYPITAITLTTISGVEGVLVEYDDGNSGQLFFADGVGLATVKSAIEGAIPHDTSELTNGAGFITISDLPIYDGGVQ